MEKQTLPNSTLVLIFGILSIVGVFCCAGIGGLLFAIIALVMANKATKTYNEDPALYNGFSNVKTGKILSWISIAIFAVFLIMVIIFVAQNGIEGTQEIWEEAVRQQEEAQRKAMEQNQ